jgi:hypothetical protein
MRESLRTYIAELTRSSREIPIAIFDDSDHAYREVLDRNVRALSAESGREIEVVRADWRERFASQLSRRGIPQDVLEFAMGGRRGIENSPGANRNAILLRCVGKSIISVDDDTRCNPAVSKVQKAGVSLASVNDGVFDPAWPGTIAAFRTVEDAVASCEETMMSFIEEHEAFLGEDVGGIVKRELDSVSQSGADGGFEAVIPNKGKVRVTVNGLVGDCGWRSGSSYLWMAKPSLNDLIDTEANYEECCKSRIIRRSVTHPIVHRNYRAFMAGFVGIDCRDVLPPFLPSGAGEDMAFACTLTSTMPRAFIAHLPIILAHHPEEVRRFSREDRYQAGLGIDLCLLYIAVLGDWLAKVKRSGDRTDGKVLQQLGRYLSDVGEMSDRAFGEYSRLVVTRFVEEQLDGLVSRINSVDGSRDWWRTDVMQLVEVFRKNRRSPHYAVPYELLRVFGVEGGRQEAADYLARMGRLLQWWPRVWAEAESAAD